MTNEEATIVWKLPREQKGRYVKAARAEGLTLVRWIERACDAEEARSPGRDDDRQPEDRNGDRDDR